MKSSEVFEVCHSRYRWLRSDTKEGRIRALVLEKPANGYSWRPVRARACEYVADFERIGRHALRRAEWKGRLKLFETYFLEGVEYRRAISLVGVAEGTFDYWFREVKKALGAEFLRTGLFPPSRYFETRNTHPDTSGQRAATRSPESGSVTSTAEGLTGPMVSSGESGMDAKNGCPEVRAVAL